VPRGELDPLDEPAYFHTVSKCTAHSRVSQYPLQHAARLATRLLHCALPCELRGGRYWTRIAWIEESYVE
jgi:hypothetical protein